jgi:hypothetical protein
MHALSRIRSTISETLHYPSPQSLEPFFEAALLGPVALGHRTREGERQGITVA